MRGVLLTSLMLILALAGIAEASEPHQGKGYRLQVPHGFRAVSPDDADTCPAHALDLVQGLTTADAEVRQVYLAGSLLEPDAMLVVARIELDPGALSASRPRHRFMLDRLHLSSEHFEGLVADGAVVLRPTEITGAEALEMTHPGAEGPLGLDEPACGALLVDGDDHAIVVALFVRDVAVYPPERTWAGVKASLSVEPPGAFMRSALMYGGMGLVGLILLVMLFRLVSRRRRLPAAPAHDAGPRLSMSSEGWGARSTPSMQPVMPAPEVEPQPIPEPAPALRVEPLEEPAPTPPPASTPPGPVALPGMAPSPSATPAPAPAAPAAPPPLPDPVPTPQPAPSAQAASSEPGAVPPPLPPTGGPGDTQVLPRREPPKAPARKGLKPTLPAGGRYSG